MKVKDILYTVLGGSMAAAAIAWPIFVAYVVVHFVIKFW